MTLLFAVVIRLEGGSWEEVAMLDEGEEEAGQNDSSLKSPTKSDSGK